MSFADVFGDLLVDEEREMRENTRGGASAAIDADTAARFGAEFGGYLVPGTGVMDAGGRYSALTNPDLDFYPGLLENLREGEYGTAAGQAMGLLGDALSFAGPAGLAAGAVIKAPRGAIKAARAVDAAGNVAQAARGAGRTGRSAAARNVKKAATGTVFDNVTDYDQALAMARRGEHLKQNAAGQYIGAPRSEGKVGLTVDSPQGLSAMRRQADQKVHEGMFNATWYDRARRTAEGASGYDPSMPMHSPEARMASLFSRGGAAYSPQAMPPVEMNAFLRQHNAKVVGNQDIVPRTGSQARNVAKAYPDDPSTGGFDLHPESIRLGKKTGPYGDAKDPTIPAESLYKTASDVWHGRVMGYSNPGGKTFNRGFTPQEHGFLTGENLLLADRANLAGASPPDAGPGFRMDPRAAQAATWGAEREAKAIANRSKALAKYEKQLGKWQRQVSRWEASGKRGNKPKKPTKPKVQTDAEIRAKARAGIDDAVERQIASQTYEFVPGEKVGQLAGMNVADDATRQQFSDEMFATMGGNRDPYFDAMQMYQQDVLPIQGEWMNSAGVLERNQAYGTRPLVGLEPSHLKTKSGKPTRGGQMLDAPGRSALDFTAGVRSVLDAQEGVGWNKFTPSGGSMRAAERTGGRITGTPAGRKAAKDALDAVGLDTVDVGDAIHVGRYESTGADGEEIQKLIDQAVSGVEGAELTRGRWETDLASPPWSRTEGTGDVTRYLEGQLTRPDIHNAPQRLDAAGIPGILSKQNDVLRNTSQRTGLPLRQDVMKMREILGKSGFAGLLDYIKKYGYAGLPALGGGAILLPGLLEEERKSDPQGAGLLS